MPCGGQSAIAGSRCQRLKRAVQWQFIKSYENGNKICKIIVPVNVDIHSWHEPDGRMHFCLFCRKTIKNIY